MQQQKPFMFIQHSLRLPCATCSCLLACLPSCLSFYTHAHQTLHLQVSKQALAQPRSLPSCMQSAPTSPSSVGSPSCMSTALSRCRCSRHSGRLSGDTKSTAICGQAGNTRRSSSSSRPVSAGQEGLLVLTALRTPRTAAAAHLAAWCQFQTYAKREPLRK